MTKHIWKIGTRASKLALWQTNWVKNLLAEQNIETTTVPIKSEGDINLISPLYEIHVQGIFTKTLDIALLNHQIDIAVHSFKDVPTKLPLGLKIGAVLPRGSNQDILVLNSQTAENFVSLAHWKEKQIICTIATSSIRRKAQWLHLFPTHQIISLRGNVIARMKKLNNSKWQGAIFAKTGLERINILPPNSISLDWMLPAPAQGAVVVVCRETDKNILEGLKKINDKNTKICTFIERNFLRRLGGGCSTPISALAQIQNNTINFRGQIISPDGVHKVEIKKQVPIEDSLTLGQKAAKELLENGGAEIMKSFT